MTDHCYIAVKGSLHATDSSVFGLTTEEIIALSKRFSDSCKGVINGVIIKGSPIQVINTLGEIGYRVICSSGETEIVWTLRREVLVSSKPGDYDDTQRNSMSAKLATLGNSILPNKNISAPARRASISPLRRGVTEDNVRTQTPQTSNAVKAVEKKKIERLGSKPEDKAEYGFRKGSTIDVKTVESFEDTPPSPEKKIILDTNLSSEANPLSAKNLEPMKTNDFVSTYSETIARPAEMTAVPQKKVAGACDAVRQSNSAKMRIVNQICQTPGKNPEFVMAEYNAESLVANAESNMKRQTPTRGPSPNITAQSSKYPRMRTPSPANQAIQKPKPVNSLGTKPEDMAQYGFKNRKIDVINMDNFIEIPEEELCERRLIINSNRSSEANPLSNRNLEPQRDLLSRFQGPSRRKD